MKKLMFAAALAAIGTTFAVESANIVGYQDVSKGAVKQPMLGFTFTPVSGASTIKLGDVKVSGMQGGKDYIQVINPTTLGMAAQYTYYSAEAAVADAADSAEELVEEGEYDNYEEAYAAEYPTFSAKIGWWTGAPGSSTLANNVDIAVGSGFLGLSTARHNLSFTCSGEAPTTPKSYAPGAVRQPIVANFIPARMYLKDIEVTGMQGGKDYIQVIDSTTLGMSAQYTYYSAAAAVADAADSAEELVEEGEYDNYEEAYADELATYVARVGWWTGAPGYSTRADNVIVEAGDAFLGLSTAAHALTFNFKSVLALTPIAAE